MPILCVFLEALKPMRVVLYLSLVFMTAPLVAISAETPQQNYSTCPDFQHAIVRDMAYVQVTEAALRKWARVRVYPKPSSAPEIVRVELQIEGDKVFCAHALNGSTEKQRAAVDAAMHWKFKKKRGNFKNDISGLLIFDF